MIRVFVEGGLQAMFHHYENVTVCEDVIDGQYIVNECNCKAGDMASHSCCGEWPHKYIFLNGENFRDAVRSGITDSCNDIFRIVRVEQTRDSAPSFIAKGTP
jgi:hypothetical protein